MVLPSPRQLMKNHIIPEVDLNLVKFDKESLVLYSTHLAVGGDRKLKRSQVARRMAIKDSTYNLYLSKLSSSGLISRRNRKQHGDEFYKIDLTEGGQKRVKEILGRIETFNFTPERHNIDHVVALKMVLNQLKHPLDKIHLLSLYCKQSYFNLPKVMDAIGSSHDETNIVNVLNRFDVEENGGNEEYFTDVYARCSLYGENRRDDLNFENAGNSDIDSLLFLAESERKHGEIVRAQDDYRTILETCRNLSHHQWFIASFNLGFIEHLKGDTEKAISIFDNMGKETKERVYLSYLSEIKAFIYSQTEEYEKARELFNSSIRSFRRLDQNLLLALALNNRGVMLFKMGLFDKAENDWDRALRIARAIPSLNIEAMALVNLADLEIKEGNLKKAGTMLDKAHEIFWEIGDFEKISCVYFNRALLSLEKNDLEMMGEHLRNSEEVAYPLPSFYERMERRKEIAFRGKEKGIKDINTYLND